ncbi:MAG: hypothetical protein K1X94_29650 [Sandaracinaceae bacterium]|jgi:hypothetical protein|nr:hypothetical protein [Sandaracinaceae bacterium]
MSRIVLVVALGSLALAGCLRPKFDLCAEDPPHPDCPHDAGPDAAVDAPAATDAASDAAVPLEDAPMASDAPVGPDAPADAGSPDVG